MKTASLFVTNETAVATLVKNQFANIRLKTNAEVQTRYEELDGKKYLVVPCVMLTEGVHNGSQGALYYPEEELSKTPAVWNGKPVVVYHPEMNGLWVSACDPVIYETRRIGMLFNTRWEDDKLKTECWIDEEKTKEVDERVINAIQNGEMMEVSTGLFTDNEEVDGEWEGETYNAICRNYRPDHLAILPDIKGACSIDDGAGLLRNQAEEGGALGLLSAHYLAIVNELSHSDIWQMLNAKIRTSESSNKWVMEVFDDFFLYEDGDQLYYQEYEIEDDEVKLIGVRKEAERITQYQLSDGTLVGNTDDLENVSFDKDSDMKKKVDALIANEKTPWTEEDRDYLMGLEEVKLDAHVANASDEPDDKPAEGGDDKPAEGAGDTPAEGGEEGADDAPAANQTFEEVLANAPADVQSMIRHGVSNYKAEKASLIQKLTANQRNTFTAAQLEAKDVDELKALVALAEVPAAPAAPGSSYLGQGEVVDNTAPVTEEPLVAPSVFE